MAKSLKFLRNFIFLLLLLCDSESGSFDFKCPQLLWRLISFVWLFKVV